MTRLRISASFAAALAVSTAAAPASANAGPPSYVGRWAAQPEWCRNKPGNTDELPIRFTARRMDGFENTCRFDRVRGGPGLWRIDATCQGEGMTERRQMELRVDGATLRLKDRGDSAATRFTRCP